jgi:hypothetical protein
MRQLVRMTNKAQPCMEKGPHRSTAERIGDSADSHSERPIHALSQRGSDAPSLSHNQRLSLGCQVGWLDFLDLKSPLSTIMLL